METLARVSNGDLRKAITTLQSAVRLQGPRVQPADGPGRGGRHPARRRADRDARVRHQQLPGRAGRRHGRHRGRLRGAFTLPWSGPLSICQAIDKQRVQQRFTWTAR